jgi:Flp pilus assembly pilin Flp
VIFELVNKAEIKGVVSMRIAKGQNLTEFLIIIGLVSLVGILVFSTLGSNIVTMFNKSNNEVENFDPFNVKNNPLGNINGPSSSTPSGTSDVNGVTVTEYTDGSVSFNYGDQDINLTPSMMTSLNEVFETSGADGMTTQVMAAVQRLIDEHAADFEPADVPINMVFGTSSRENDHDSSEVAGGSASVNIVAISAGDHVVMITNDHDAVSTDTPREGAYEFDVILNNDGTMDVNSANYVSDPANPLSLNMSQLTRDYFSYSNDTNGDYVLTLDPSDIYKNVDSSIATTDKFNWEITFPSLP